MGCAERGLVRALRGLVLGESLGRVDVAEHRMIRDERLRQVERRTACEHRGERLHLHLAEAGESLDPPLQIVAVGCVAPDPRGVAAVLLGDDCRQFLHALRHVAREAVDRRLLAEDGVEPVGVERRDLGRVEPAQPLLQLERAEERRRHRHLLVEREADQQCERVARDQRVRFLVAR